MNIVENSECELALLRKVADAAVANVKAVRAWREFVWMGSDAEERFQAITLAQMESREGLVKAVAEYIKLTEEKA